jgi:hypothetical protein
VLRFVVIGETAALVVAVVITGETAALVVTVVIYTYMHFPQMRTHVVATVFAFFG